MPTNPLIHRFQRTLGDTVDSRTMRLQMVAMAVGTKYEIDFCRTFPVFGNEGFDSIQGSIKIDVPLAV